MSTGFVWNVIKGPKDGGIMPAYYPYYVDVSTLSRCIAVLIDRFEMLPRRTTRLSFVAPKADTSYRQKVSRTPEAKAQS
jgi:hypothetical protein